MDDCPVRSRSSDLRTDALGPNKNHSKPTSLTSYFASAFSKAAIASVEKGDNL